MTANQTHAGDDILAALANAGRAFLSGTGKVFLAVMIVLAAGLLAVATAIAGLFLATAAIVIRLTGARRKRPAAAASQSGEAVTLEAHRTARGWTVE